MLPVQPKTERVEKPHTKFYHLFLLKKPIVVEKEALHRKQYRKIDIPTAFVLVLLNIYSIFLLICIIIICVAVNKSILLIKIKILVD